MARSPKPAAIALGARAVAEGGELLGCPSVERQPPHRAGFTRASPSQRLSWRNGDTFHAYNRARLAQPRRPAAQQRDPTERFAHVPDPPDGIPRQYHPKPAALIVYRGLIDQRYLVTKPFASVTAPPEVKDPDATETCRRIQRVTHYSPYDNPVTAVSRRRDEYARMNQVCLRTRASSVIILAAKRTCSGTARPRGATMTKKVSDEPRDDVVRSDAEPNGESGTEGLAYAEALAVLQAHHDRPGSVAESDLAHAFLRGYLPRWQRHIRYAAYRQGFTADDVDTVVDNVVHEFFLRKVLVGQFDPARSEFAIFRTLIQQRAIDRHRHLQTASGAMNRPGRTDIADLTLPVSRSAEDEALTPKSTEEDANAKLCRDAGLDHRETDVITYRYVHKLQWDDVLALVNTHAERPVGLPRLRNIHTDAKRKIKAYVARRTNEESF
jgi:hypothetical protein